MHGSGYNLKEIRVGKKLFLYLRHLCQGVYSFCLFLRLFVGFSVALTKITSKFCVKVSQMSISQQPLIRKHSYLGHGYLRGSAYNWWILAPGSLPQGGARGENQGHPRKVLYCFFFYAYPFLRHQLKHQSSIWPSLKCHEVKVIRPIFHDWMILPYILKTIWWMNVLLGIMGQCDTKIYLIKYMYI